jgi:hypothetical protein
MDREHFIKVGQDHLDALDDYPDWMPEHALHSWAADAAQAALADGDDKLAERLSLDGRVTALPEVRKAFKDRLKVLGS